MAVRRRRFLLAWLLAASIAGCASGEEQIWREYLEWYRRQPVSVTDTRGAYLRHLRESGASEDEIRKRSEVIERLSRERREELQPLFFDRTYASETARYATEPNALLREAVRGRRPGKALDVHMGQGRNAVFLASLGWDVTGFDYSEEGIRAAREAARKAGVKIEAVVARHEDFDFGVDRWDLVVLSYTWLPLRSPWVEKILTSLKPGGLLVFEHMLDESGSESAAPWLPRPNQLLELFGRLRILKYEDVRAEADWSWRPERVARLVAEKARSF